MESLFNIQEDRVYFGNGNLSKKHKAIVNSSNQECIGIVSKHYKPISNHKALQYLHEILSAADIKAEVGKDWCINNGSKTIIEVKFPEYTDSDNGYTARDFRLYLRNSFDGSSSVYVESGLMEYICSNLMMIGSISQKHIIRHSGDIDNKIVEAFKMQIDKQFTGAIHWVNILKSINFNNYSEKKIFVEGMIKHLSIAKRYKQAIYSESYNQGKSLNLWATYNVFTYVISHVMRINQSAKMAMLHKLNKAWNINSLIK